MRLICSSFLTPILYSAGTLLTSGSEINDKLDLAESDSEPEFQILVCFNETGLLRPHTHAASVCSNFETPRKRTRDTIF